ncbi:MAG: Holliday junction resolvase [Candidatus Paceibacteria bacterium]|jgi:Holliday junction resolvase
MEIVKNNGEKESFDPDKLKGSLERAGATVFVANDITSKIQKDIKDGSTTTDIYKEAFELLKKTEKKSALRYSIRRSVLDLGPSGFPFEKFIAEIFSAKGFTTEVGVTLKGHCADHEVDIIAYNEKELIITEAKFHNKSGIKTDTKTALYIKARFDDLQSEEFHLGGKKRKMTQGLMVTNTKFTHTARKYVNCVGTYDLISWDYPKKGNLYDLMEETTLHPLTCVAQLSKSNKNELLDRGIVNCRSLRDEREVMKEIGLSDEKIDEIIENIDIICSH